jgi:hypothetical protein
LTPPPPRWAAAEREKRTSKQAATANVRADRGKIVMRESVSPGNGGSQNGCEGVLALSFEAGCEPIY